MMNRIILLLFLLVGFQQTRAQSLHLSDEGSSVKFKIKNLGVAITGSFTGLSGSVLFNSIQPSSGRFQATVNAATINTGIDMRDDHLRGESYFNTKQYPVIQFESTGIEPARKKGHYLMKGKLTIKNITRDISFPFTAEAKDGGYLFTGQFRINRRDFTVGSSSITLSDDVDILLSVMAR
jgi:polyisoprenoid-binding protein YceI